MKIGTVRGIVLKLHYSTLLIAGLVGYGAASFYDSLAGGTEPLWGLFVVGILGAVMILFSILLHELMHSIVAQGYGMKISEIELYLFGGVSKLEGEPKTPGQEAKMAVVGPVTSLVLGVAFYAPTFFIGNLSYLALGILTYSGLVNLLLGVFNLLPAYPMDGGRVLRAILWQRRKNMLSATKAASKVGSGFAYGMIGVGFFLLLFVNLIDGIWFIILGMFLNSTAKQSYAQAEIEDSLGHLKVRDLIGAQPRVVEYNSRIEQVVMQDFMPYRALYFPVVNDGKIVGVIFANQVQRIPQEQRAKVTVGQVMLPIQLVPVIGSNQPASDILEKFGTAKGDPRIVLVKREDDGMIVGLVSEIDVQSTLQFLSIQKQTRGPGPSWVPVQQ
jgi:Zn-dependent protease/CBS domain-containing protein